MKLHTPTHTRTRTHIKHTHTHTDTLTYHRFLAKQNFPVFSFLFYIFFGASSTFLQTNELARKTPRGQQQQLANALTIRAATTTTTIEFWAKNISIANTTNAFVTPSPPCACSYCSSISAAEKSRENCVTYSNECMCINVCVRVCVCAGPPRNVKSEIVRRP